MKEKVLITGASGFLGSAIASELSKHNYEVVAVVRSLENSWRLNELSSMRILEGDVEKWEAIIEKEAPHIVISADWSGVAKDYRDEHELQFSNAHRIKRIANAAIRVKSKIFLHLGSQAEYGNLVKPISDFEKLNPRTAYAIAKVNLHNELKDLFQGSTTKLIWARVFSVYGPKDTNPSLINSIIKALALNQEIGTSNGEQNWSYIYISDFASAIRALVESDLMIDEVNIGNPKSIKIKDVLKLISSEMNKVKLIKIGEIKAPKEGWPSLEVNPEVLLSTGWEARTTLEEGIASTINWWLFHIEDKFSSYS